MERITRRAILGLSAGVVGLALAGCDAGTLTYFLMPEPRLEAKLKHLPSTDEKKVPVVLILTWANTLEMRSEFIGADRRLTEYLCAALNKLAEPNGEALKVIPPRRIEEFKNQNPDWRSMSHAEMGRKFGADYVIAMEMNYMSLFEPGSGNQIYRGRANVSISLTDVAKPDMPTQRDTHVAEFPREGLQNYDAGTIPPMQFRDKFLENMAKHISYYFSRHPREARYEMSNIRD